MIIYTVPFLPVLGEKLTILLDFCANDVDNLLTDGSLSDLCAKDDRKIATRIFAGFYVFNILIYMVYFYFCLIINQIN